MVNNPIIIRRFSQIDINDPFFDSLKEDYQEFEKWFQRKANEGKKALILLDKNKLEAFLYLKREDEEITDVVPHLPKALRMKIGTFKINAHGTKLGERFIKKIFDYTLLYLKTSEAYVTIFPKHTSLINLLFKYGFEKVGTKTTKNGMEWVLLKDFFKMRNDVDLDFPKIKTRDKNKYVLAIYPEYHTQLFPDSILTNENYDIIKDVSHTNSIQKVYICFMNVSSLKNGDILVIYRTSDGKGSARFRSVVTSICVVKEVKRKSDFKNQTEYLEYCEKRSVFNRAELIQWYQQKRQLFIIKMTYNAAFTKRLTRGYLLDNIGLSTDIRWSFFKLTDSQFDAIIKAGNIDGNLIIN